jgi:hypothetical protein
VGDLRAWPVRDLRAWPVRDPRRPYAWPRGGVRQNDHKANVSLTSITRTEV